MIKEERNLFRKIIDGQIHKELDCNLQAGAGRNSHRTRCSQTTLGSFPLEREGGEMKEGQGPTYLSHLNNYRLSPSDIFSIYYLLYE